MPVAIKQSLVLALMTTLLPGLSLAAPFPFTSPDGHRHAGRHPFHHPWQHRPAPDAMPAGVHDRPPAPALLAEPRPDLPVPASGDDCAHLAAGAPFDLPLLSTLFHPAWDDLDENQQAVLAPFAPEWNTWPMAERRSWLAFADRMQSLDEQQRSSISLRIALNPPTPFALNVRIGPAEIAFTRMLSSPKSRAKYLTFASKLALATPITL